MQKKLAIGLFSFSCCEDSVTGDSKLYAKTNGKLFFGTVEELEHKIVGHTIQEKYGKQIIKPKDKLEVLSVEGGSKKESKVVWKQAKYFIKHYVEKPVLQIILRTGKSIKVTGDHSLFKRIITNRYIGNYKSTPIEKIAPCKASELNKIDSVWCVDDYSFDVPDHQIDDDLLVLIGLWLADGCYDHTHGIHISTGNDKDILSFLRKISRKFKFNLTVRKNGDTTLNSRSFMRKFKEEFKLEGYSHTKKIPPWCFLMSNRQINLLLKGYFSGDGTCEKNAVSCTSVSFELINGLKELLNRLGIVTSISLHKKRNIVFGSKKYIGSESYSLAITKRDSYNKFIEIGFLQNHKNKKLKKHNKFRNKFYGLIAHSVKEIKVFEGKCYVYDFDVPQTQNFVANGILCHNSTIIFTELLNDHYVEWFKLIDFKSARVLKKSGEIKDIDVAFVEGAIANQKDEEELKKIRANSKKLVAIGACAMTGMPSAQRNDFSDALKKEIFPMVRFYGLKKKVQKLDELVTVDDKVPGCPMSEALFLNVLNKYLKEFGVVNA